MLTMLDALVEKRLHEKTHHLNSCLLCICLIRKQNVYLQGFIYVILLQHCAVNSTHRGSLIAI